MVRDTMSVVRPGAGAGAPGRRSGVMVHHHTTAQAAVVSYLPVQPGHTVLVPPPLGPCTAMARNHSSIGWLNPSYAESDGLFII